MKVTIREFQHNATKYLDKLPITLTRYNISIAEVIRVDTKFLVDNSTPIKPKDLTIDDPDKIPTPEEKPWKQVTRCEYQTCRKDAIGHFSIETYSTDTGDQTIQKHLCKLHKHLANKEGKVTEV